MHTKKRGNFLSLIIMLAMLAGLQGCYIPQFPPDIDDIVDVPEEKKPVSEAYPHPASGNEDQASNPQPQPDPDPESEPGPIEVMFLEQDCSIEGLVVKDTNYGTGSLYCTYQNHAALTIKQYNDPGQYQTVFDGGKRFRQNAIDTFKATQAAGGLHKNYNVDVIQDDDAGTIYLESYDDNPTVDDPAIPFCGYGMGTLGVDDKFVVTVELDGLCDASSRAEDYIQILTALRDGALAAIARASAASAP
jgi:hypothetical protein